MPTPLANSTFLDWNSYRTNAPAPSGGTPLTDFKLNVALVLDRAHTPDFLNGDWASRQHKLTELGPTGVAHTYGADPAKYAQVLSDLAAMNIKTVDQVSASNGYVSSIADRRSGQVDKTSFRHFSHVLLQGTISRQFHPVLNGISSPDGWASNLGVHGLSFDNSSTTTWWPIRRAAATLPQGAEPGQFGFGPTHRFRSDRLSLPFSVSDAAVQPRLSA